MYRPALATCAGFSVFAFVTLVAFTIALKTHIMTLDKLPHQVRENATSACLAAGMLYGSCALICVYYIKHDSRKARELKFVTAAQATLLADGTRMTEAGRKLAVRVRRDLLADIGLGEPFLGDKRYCATLSQHLNRGSSGRAPRVPL